jgi:hypothetical protein
MPAPSSGRVGRSAADATPALSAQPAVAAHVRHHSQYDKPCSGGIAAMRGTQLPPSWTRFFNAGVRYPRVAHHQEMKLTPGQPELRSLSRCSADLIAPAGPCNGGRFSASIPRNSTRAVARAKEAKMLKRTSPW